MTPDSPWLGSTFADDQNVELKYLFAYLGPVPTTMGNPAAPDVRLQLAIKSPFTKHERWQDGTDTPHEFSYGLATKVDVVRQRR